MVSLIIVYCCYDNVTFQRGPHFESCSERVHLSHPVRTEGVSLYHCHQSIQNVSLLTKEPVCAFFEKVSNSNHLVLCTSSNDESVTYFGGVSTKFHVYSSISSTSRYRSASYSMLATRSVHVLHAQKSHLMLDELGFLDELPTDIEEGKDADHSVCHRI